MSLGRAPSFFVVIASLATAVGCPALLSDDFRVVPREAPDGGATDAGWSARDDAGSVASGAGRGGASTSGGSAGASASGGSAGASADETGGVAHLGGGASALGMGGNGARGQGGGEALDDAGSANTGADGDACVSCGALSACCPPHWSSMSEPPAAFVAREQAAYVAVGTSVFVWGGADDRGVELDDGALYDAELDTWTSVATDAATPSARVLSTAVWTGSALIVWGGGDRAGLTDYATGSRYDVAAGKWTPMSVSGAPSARRAAYGVWTGTRVLLWGGVTATHAPVGGAYLYDPASDIWTAGSVSGEPTAPLNPTVGWTGSELIIYGGRAGGTSYTGHTYGYDVAMDAWLQRPAGPQARQGAFGTWDGASLIAWGGTSSTIKKDGQRYSLTQNAWNNMASTGAPTARYAAHRETGWSAHAADMTTLMLGGYDANQNPFTDGAHYASTTNTWTTIAPWPSASAHLWGVGAWTGTAFVLWGGRVKALGALTTVGERFRF